MADKTLNSLVGGGGGLPINGTTPINTNEAKYESEGVTWLRSGVLETDIVNYPDATVNELVLDTGESFSISGVGADTWGITWDGSHFWVVGPANKKVYKYTVDGTYTGVSFSTSAQSAYMRSIAWDGEFFWLTDSTYKTVYKYTAAGAYTGFSFSTANEITSVDMNSIAWDGSHFWVSGSTIGTVYKYTDAGVYTGESFPIKDSIGLTWDGEFFWATNNGEPKLSKYTQNWEELEMAPSGLGLIDTYMRGMAIVNSHLYMVGGDTKRVYKLLPTTGAGLPVETTDPDTGLTIYTRIK